MQIPSRSILSRVLGSVLGLAVLLPVSSRADIAIVIEEFIDKIVVRYPDPSTPPPLCRFPDLWASELDPSDTQIFFSDIVIHRRERSGRQR